MVHKANKAVNLTPRAAFSFGMAKPFYSKASLHTQRRLLRRYNSTSHRILAVGLPTKKDTVNQALMEFVQRRKQREITSLFGSLPQDADYDYKKGRK